MTEEESRLLQAIYAKLSELCKEVHEDRVSRDALAALRRAAADRKARQRSRNSHVTVRDSHGTREVVKEALKLDLEQKQEQVLKIPASRDSHGTGQSRDTGPAREAYSTAYEKRHGAKPVWNATTNAQMARFVKRVGIEEAPAIAEFYVSHKSAWYVQQLHPVSLLLKDAEKLHTEWVTGHQITATKANQEERTQENVQGWEALRRRSNGVVGP